MSALAANIHISQLLDRYGPVLTEKQQRILDGYYNCDLSLSEIAENEGMTRQGASDFVKRAEAQLTELEQKLGLCYKAEELRELFSSYCDGKADISELADMIDNF